MNGAHLHLILNHVPVILAPTALVILILGVWRRNEEFVRVGLGLFVAAALFAIPSFLTGDPAADIVERYSGVTTQAIERHEAAATGALVAILLVGLASLTHLVREWRHGDAPPWLVPMALILGCIATVWLGVAANFGGQVRHQEIRATTQLP